MTDFAKLLAFAKMIGIPVVYRKGSKADAAVFVYDGDQSQIELSKKSRSITNALVLLHELGHAVDWIQQGRPKESPTFLGMADSKMRRKDRFLYWENERRGINNMTFIYNLLQLSISRVRMETEKIFDLWVYNYFYREGKYPPKRQRKSKWNQIYKNNKRLYENVISKS